MNSASIHSIYDSSWSWFQLQYGEWIMFPSLIPFSSATATLLSAVLRVVIQRTEYGFHVFPLTPAPSWMTLALTITAPSVSNRSKMLIIYSFVSGYSNFSGGRRSDSSTKRDIMSSSSRTLVHLMINYSVGLWSAGRVAKKGRDHILC